MGNDVNTMCPCASSWAEAFRKNQMYSSLQQGEIFKRKVKALGFIPKEPEDIKLCLAPDHKKLTWKAVDEKSKHRGQIELASVKSVESKGELCLVLVGTNSDSLLEVEASSSETRDEWARNIEEALELSKASKARPTANTEEKAKTVVDTMKEKAQKESYFLKKDLELRKQKHDSEKKKAQLMKELGGGLKYTAVAMANMSER